MIVFVHGVPETAAIWRKMRAAIGIESVALPLPGFGSPRPEGFGASKAEYVAWLADRLDAFDEPVHLVGHDWGALLTYRVAMAHGDRLRSWVADIGNGIHPDYVWHDLAQTWQTPGAGETAIEQWLALPAETLAGRLTAFHVSQEDAHEMAAGIDPVMTSSILALYRSATPNVHHDWGPLVPTSAPGLVLHPAGDPFSAREQAREVAAALGAEFAIIDGAHHFWPYEAPETAAGILKSFWGSAG